MMRFTKQLRSPLFLCFVFMVLLALVSGLALKKSRVDKVKGLQKKTVMLKEHSEDSRELQISINRENEIMLNENVVDRTELRPAIREITEADHPVHFVLKNDEGASYATYVEVYDALRDVLRDLRQQAAMTNFGKSYSVLDSDKKEAIDTLFPLKVNEVFIASLERN